MNVKNRVPGLFLLTGLLAAAGCSSDYDVTPSTVSARAALETALTSWKDGGKPGTIAGSEPAIQIVDSTWQAGRKLQSFEILKEEETDTDRRFSVKLVQRDPAATTEVQYVVIGKAPVWIYREEDYKRMLDMDNNPRPVKTPQRRGR